MEQRTSQSFFRKLHKKIKVIVLDVTDMGWREGCAFTIENNFWSARGMCVYY